MTKEERRKYNRRYYAVNRKRLNEEKKDYRKNHPEVNSKAHRKWVASNRSRSNEISLKSKRSKRIGKGSHEHLLEQVAKQDNRCAVCDKEFIKTPCLDHNKGTGQWRGALCNRCNLLLGSAEESIEIFWKAIKYLNKWRKQ